MLMEVLSHYFTENGAIFIHILNLFVLGMLLFLFFFARQAGKKWSKINDYLGVITKTVNSVRYGDLSKKVERMELPSTEPLAESINRMIETLYDREKMIYAILRSDEPSGLIKRYACVSDSGFGSRSLRRF